MKSYYHHKTYLRGDVKGICEGCGAPFIKNSSSHRFCNRACKRNLLSPRDLVVLSKFKAICDKYKLGKSPTFHRLTLIDQRDWFHLFRSQLHPISKQKKDRVIAVIEKFFKDFEVGWYDIKKTRHCFYSFNYIERRALPRAHECPMKFFNCKGGLFPGDCPRRFRECDLWITQ